MAKFNEYTQKATPEDADTLMIYDAASKANKLSPFSGIWNWIVGKLTNAVIANLQTNNKTVLGAINELNSNTHFDVTAPNNVSIINNISIKVGRVVYVAVKIKITGVLDSEEILKFSSNATNDSTVFVIGKGTEWNINNIVYGYLGGNSVIVSNKNVVSIGDYLHINTVIIL